MFSCTETTIIIIVVVVVVAVVVVVVIIAIIIGVVYVKTHQRFTESRVLHNCCN